MKEQNKNIIKWQNEQPGASPESADDHQAGSPSPFK